MLHLLGLGLGLGLNILSLDVWLPFWTTHRCVGDISPEGELSNLRVYKKSFITMFLVSSKMINSPFGEKL